MFKDNEERIKKEAMYKAKRENGVNCIVQKKMDCHCTENKQTNKKKKHLQSTRKTMFFKPSKYEVPPKHGFSVTVSGSKTNGEPSKFHRGEQHQAVAH